jgi:hypothetical protein
MQKSLGTCWLGKTYKVSLELRRERRWSFSEYAILYKYPPPENFEPKFAARLIISFRWA